MNNEDYEKLLKEISELLGEDPDTVKQTDTHRLTIIDVTYN